MDQSEKQGNPVDVWSDEADHHGHAKGKRSYDCAFCKRGFTNAQALGGHMNIHRRDRAKATAKPLPAVTSFSSNPYAPVSGNFPASCFSALETQGHSHFQQRQVMPAAGTNPRQAQGHFAPRVMIPNCLNSSHGDLWGANLSLGIGSGGMKEDHELDLELRLGQLDP